MPKLIYHDLKSTQRKTSIYSKNNNNTDPNNNDNDQAKRDMPKPAKPQVKNLKYVDLIVRWRKKTADSKRQKMAEKGWDQESGKKAEERQRWREEYNRDRWKKNSAKLFVPGWLMILLTTFKYSKTRTTSIWLFINAFLINSLFGDLHVL